MYKFFILFFAVISLQIHSQELRKGFYLQYSTPRVKIEIKDGIIYHNTFRELYENSLSTMPTKKEPLNRKASITEYQTMTLVKATERVKFFDLKNEYGASPNEKFYQYSLEIKVGDASKLVVFRSNPSFEGAPDEFNRVIQEVNLVLDSISKWETN